MIVKKSDDAISPVIGVMLMLAVTIIIAAVVVAISTGMMTDTEPAPTAKLDIVIDSEYYRLKNSNSQTYYYIPNMLITHVSGDPLNTADLRLTFAWDCPHGSSCKYTNDGHHYSTYAYEDTPNGWDEKYNVGLPGGDGSNDGMFNIYGVYRPSGYKGTVQPLYINGGSFDGEYFGSCMMERGDTFHAFSLHLIEPRYHGFDDVTYHHKGNPALDVILDNGNVWTESSDGKLDYGSLGLKPCPIDGCEGYLEYDPEYDETLCSDCEEFYAEGNYAGYTSGDIAGILCQTPGCPGSYCLEDNYGYYCPLCLKNYSGSENPGIHLPGSRLGELTPGIMECLPAGTPVDVKVIHIPSNKPIYSKTVYVQ